MSDFAGHFLSEFFGLNKKVDDIVNNLVDDETPFFTKSINHAFSLLHSRIVKMAPIMLYKWRMMMKTRNVYKIVWTLMKYLTVESDPLAKEPTK